MTCSECKADLGVPCPETHSGIALEGGLRSPVMGQKDTKTDALTSAQLCPPPWAGGLGWLSS